MNELKQLRDWLDNELLASAMIPCSDSEFEIFIANYSMYIKGVPQATARWQAKTDIIYRRIDR